MLRKPSFQRSGLPAQGLPTRVRHRSLNPNPTIELNPPRYKYVYQLTKLEAVTPTALERLSQAWLPRIDFLRPMYRHQALP